MLNNSNNTEVVRKDAVCKMEYLYSQGAAELFSCSNCGSVHDYAFNISHCSYLSNFCPSCGAKVSNPDSLK